MWGWPVVEEYWNYPGMEGKPVKVSVYSMAAENSVISEWKADRSTAVGKAKTTLSLLFSFPISLVNLNGGQSGGRERNLPTYDPYARPSGSH